MTMNKRDLFKMYLSEDVQRAEDNYRRWQEGYARCLTSDKASVELRTYYKRECEVAFEIWHYKVKCYNNKFRGSKIIIEE